MVSNLSFSYNICQYNLIVDSLIIPNWCVECESPYGPWLGVRLTAVTAASLSS